MRISFARRALLAAGLCFSLLAHAGAPQQKTQVPGWYRTMVGGLEVTALYDGYFDLDPAQLLKNTHPGEVKRDLARAFIPGPLVRSRLRAGAGRPGAADAPARRPRGRRAHA